MEQLSEEGIQIAVEREEELKDDPQDTELLYEENETDSKVFDAPAAHYDVSYELEKEAANEIIKATQANLIEFRDAESVTKEDASEIVEATEANVIEFRDPESITKKDVVAEDRIEEEPAVQNEAAKNLNETENEEEDSVIIFEGIEDTALTQAINGAIETGKKVTQFGCDGAKSIAGSASKKVTDFFSRHVDRKEDSYSKV